MKRTSIFTAWIALVIASLSVLAGCGSHDDGATHGVASLVCTAGTAGCNCGPAAACNAGLTCNSGICVASSCAPGDKGCACGTAGFCAPNGTCVNNVCVDPTGTPGNPCFSNGTCDVGASCNAQKACVACVIGAAGCACTPSPDGGAATCATGSSCVSNTCIANTSPRKRRTGQECFQRCNGNLTTDAGATITCNLDEGLMAFNSGDPCTMGLTCTDGACAGPSGPTKCTADVDCQDFEGCLQGVCASECDFDSDCPDETYVCSSHVCRTTCGANSTNDCTNPPGYTCRANPNDGTGLCLPTRGAADAGTTTTVTGTYHVLSTTVVFGKTTLTQTITISNESDQARTYTVSKVSHVDYSHPDPKTGQPPYVIPQHGVQPDGGLAVGDTPMPWLAMGAVGQSQLRNVYAITIPANAQGVVELQNVSSGGSGPPDQWEGVVNVSSDVYGTTAVHLRYAAPASGHWVGQVYYFEQFGDQGLDAWIAGGRATGAVQNAFMNRWSAYRSNNMLVGLSLYELEDVINSTVTETWRDQGITAQCGGGFCYPTNLRSTGLGKYSSDDDKTLPIPRGPVKMQLGLDLVQVGNSLAGVINSEDSLQYAGQPSVQINFAGDPTACSATDGSKDAWGRCRVWATSMSADVLTGARYISDTTDPRCAWRALPDGGAAPSGADAGDLVQGKTPWLVPAFTAGTAYDQGTGLRYTYECRDTTVPLSGSAAAQNRDLAGANPIPDGRSRRRHIDLVDGLVYDTETMIIVFRERFDSGFLGMTGSGATGPDGGADAGFVKYGIMTLKRAPQPPKLTAPPPPPPPDTRQSAVPLQSANACANVTKLAFGKSTPLTALSADQINQLFSTIVDGSPINSNPCVASSGPPAYAPGQVHYLCKATDMFDTAEVCSQSDITYFAFTNPSDPKNGDLGKLPCNTPTSGVGSCHEILKSFEGAQIVDTSPVWKCAAGATSCDTISDMRLNKTFFPSASNNNGGAIATNQIYVPLQSAVDAAFRYKTQFQNRAGTSLGFAPSICVPDSNAVPYCYDSVAAEQLRDRLSCLTYLYSTQYDQLYASVPPSQSCVTVDNRTRAHGLMSQQFSYLEDPDPTGMLQNKVRHYGFEYLNAELLIMLGDDAYTKAFESRFDLAGSLTAAFQGSLFEPNGVDLSGGAGFELYTLYEAAQYYQMVLDHFFSLSPYMWQSIQQSGSDATRGRVFVDATTVTSYISKLTRASTQKSRAWGEVSKRYQQLNRPDLARIVIERAYTATYLESILFGRFLTQLVAVNAGPQLTQLRATLDQTKRTYEAALLDMQDVFSTITDQVTYFGFAADYIPFPVVDDPTGQNQSAFDVTMAGAMRALQDAHDKEDLAIAQDRSYESDSSAFQSQLTQIRNQYDDQLAQICGTFTGDDGKVYPAIPRYAPLGSKGTNPSNPNGAPRLLGDPCGLVGNGGISAAVSQLSTSRLDAQKIQVQSSNLQAQIDNELKRVNAECKATVTTDNYLFSLDSKIGSLSNVLIDDKIALSEMNRAMDLTTKTISMMACFAGVTGTDCPSHIAVAAVLAAFGAAKEVAASQMEQSQGDTEKQIEALKLQQGQWKVDHACDLMQIDSNAKINDLALGFKELDLEALKQSEGVHLALANIQSLRNQATRLEQEQDEAAQLAVNSAAAKNDPNTRIYKNDAIINADTSFQVALQGAYKATRVFEYYTSQSYAHKVDLTLVRLVSHGDYNLENYTRSLQAAYSTFQESYGKPDVRVVSLDLCDDMLQIPYYDATGKALGQADRRNLCRAAMLDPAHLDPNGYIRIPFSTSSAQLSPLTRNHKILYVAADFFMEGTAGNESNVTKHVFAPRVYIRQSGTGTVNALDGSRQYFRFPARTAVVDAMFDGFRSDALNADVYRNDRFRDRPFLNTAWDLTLNLKDEPANVDVDMNRFQDVQLWVYYTDFTAM